MSDSSRNCGITALTQSEDGIKILAPAWTDSAILYCAVIQRGILPKTSNPIFSEDFVSILIAIGDVWVQVDFNLLRSSAIKEARSDLKVVIFIQFLLINLNFRSESLGIKISSVLSYVQSRSHLCWYFGSSRSVIQDWLIVLILSILLCRIFLFRIKIVVNSRVLPSLDSPNKGENSNLNVLFVKLYHFAVVKLIKRIEIFEKFQHRVFLGVWQGNGRPEP